MIPVEQQLELLVEKLKGKSVYSRLSKISEKGPEEPIDEIISISSLLTHSAIEMKKDWDYKMLLCNLYESLGKLIYNLKK